MPFVSVDEVKGQAYDMVMRPGAIYSIEITPVSLDGTFGIFFARSFAITGTGRIELTPYPLEGIIVAGGARPAQARGAGGKPPAKRSPARKPPGRSPSARKPAATRTAKKPSRSR